MLQFILNAASLVIMTVLAIRKRHWVFWVAAAFLLVSTLIALRVLLAAS